MAHSQSGLAHVVAAAFASLLSSQLSCTRDRAPSPAPQTNPDETGARWLDLANDLAMLAAGRPASSAELDKLASLHFARSAFEAYLAELITSEDAARLVVHVLQLDRGGSRVTKGVMGVLQHVEQDGDTLYYLHTACGRSDTVAVKPWWDLTKTILVCGDSYRPEVFGNEAGATCTGHELSPIISDSPCGCGPNLIRCSPDDKVLGELQRAVRSEHEATIAYIVNHDLPLETIFTSNESFRTGLAEFAYQRWQIESGEIKSLDELPAWSSWPKSGKWAPRRESRKGEHAGILTNNYFPYGGDSIRLRMAVFFYALWGDVVKSSQVSTHTLLDLTFHMAKANFRGHVDPSQLAALPVCTTCHARMDYGAQFFNGMQWTHLATAYDPRRQLDTPGPMYLADIHDLRGTADRNPASFVKLALAQPEFATAIAHDFTRHAFGRAEDSGTLVDALTRLVREHASYRTLLTRTLDDYTDRRFAEATPASNNNARVASVGVPGLIDTYCSDCHDAGNKYPPGRVVQHGTAWCRVAGTRCPDLALDILIPVASRRMPKDQYMSPAARVAMIEALAVYAWPDARQRAISVRFFTEQAVGGKPIHSAEAIRAYIHGITNAPPDLATTPVPTKETFGTSLAAAMAVMAARSCVTQEDKRGCMRRALSPSAILK